MSARLATATRIGLREQARRPLLIVLLVGLPFFFITRAIAQTEATPRLIGLPGGGEALTTMREVHGADMAAITIAFLTALCGVFTMNSAQRVDRRLVAGLSPQQALVPRLAVLAVATILVVIVSSAVTVRQRHRASGGRCGGHGAEDIPFAVEVLTCIALTALPASGAAG